MAALEKLNEQRLMVKLTQMVHLLAQEGGSPELIAAYIELKASRAFGLFSEFSAQANSDAILISFSGPTFVGDPNNSNRVVFSVAVLPPPMKFDHTTGLI